MDIPMLLEIPAAIVPDRTAVADDERELSYGELAAAANAVAERLVAEGVEPGAHVIVLGVNTVGFVAALFGIAAAGAVAVPVNYRVREDELTYLLQDSGAAAVLTQPRYRGLAEAAGAGLVLDLDEVSTPAPDADGELHRVRDLDYDAVALILYTSGTTAAPKGVMLGHAGLAGYVMLGRDAPDGTDAGSSVLAAPLYHVAGLTALLNALYVGRTTYLMPRFEPAEWLELVESRSVTHAFVVPTMLARILDDEAFAPERVSSLDLLTYGAAPMPPALIRRAVEVFPVNVDFSGAYGQTETSSTVAVLEPEDHKLRGDAAEVARREKRLSSVGKVVDDVEVRVIGGDGEPLEAGVEGELQLRTERSMQGYWGGSAESTRVTVDEEGWLSTGDLGYVDEGGYLFLTGRRGDLIIRGGQNVAPAEVEAVLHEHPDVDDVAVLGVPDEEWGERVAAAVVRRPGSKLEEADVLEFAARNLAGYRRPEVVVFAEELPRNVMGKLVRRELMPLIEAAAGRVPG